MRTTFSTCILVNFAIDPHALKQKLPSHLEPDLHDGMGYVSIVIAKMEKMRPAFLPPALGITYHQVVYRAVVRCGAERGVTFLRSDADNHLMVAAGNALTFFRFHYSRISWHPKPNGIHFSLCPANGDPAEIDATYETAAGPAQLPASCRFADLRSAQAFLSELYVAFGGVRAEGRVEVVRIERNLWESSVVPDHNGLYNAMTSGLLFNQNQASLDSIFRVRNLHYRWERLSLKQIGT